jgi:hypothetical protein
MNCPRFASSFTPFENRGRREDRVRAAPAVSCAIAQKNAHTSIQVQRRASGLPCAMVLRRTSCSSRCANSFSHRYPRIDGWSWPGWARASSADVTPATGARTTRLGRTRHALRQVSTGLVPSRRSLTQGALASVVGVPSVRSRSPREGPPCDDVCAPDAAASTAPRPAFSDDRETPLCGGRDTGGCTSDLGETRSGLFLRERIDRLLGDLPVGHLAVPSAPRS